MFRLVILVIGLILFQPGGAADAVGPMDETALRSAWALYTQQKYAASADAFESLIRTSTPNARLYYYAAAANKSSNRLERAKQLCQYIVTNFSSSNEASLAQKLFPEIAAKTTSASDGLPEALKGKRLEDLMQTEEGRKTLKEALKQQKSTTSNLSTVASSKSPSIEKSKSLTQSGRPFTAADIAADGESGITQFVGQPNCCFECSMAALATLPRGQELMAEMIRTSSQGQGTYTVRFPGDGVDYTITQKKIERAECATKPSGRH